MVWRSQQIYAGDTSPIPPEPPQIEPPVPPKELAFLQQMTFNKLARFHRDKCLYPKCRLCMDNCPMEGIDLTVDPPVVARPCISCYFCEQICPTGAIDADEEKQELMASHISKVLKEVGAEHLKEAEAGGRFRRLIPMERLNWETPIFKVYNRHPRWIIGKGRQPGTSR
jgi:ferredoxin